MDENYCSILYYECYFASIGSAYCMYEVCASAGCMSRTRGGIRATLYGAVKNFIQNSIYIAAE